ncbi:adenosylcobinamide-GDP ribazoletransferase [Thermohalobacter berrensis]|nr:adenosylcobinamide-GDP ribazoletransferase [Thermohalobacter berrensis]
MLTFMTRLPIKYPYKFKEDDFVKGILYLPIVGLVIGLILWLPTFLYVYFDRFFISVLVWLVYLWVTGGLHIDGLADSFDGLFSNRNRERILEIMKDSRIGTFGVLSIFFVLIFNITLTYYLDFKVLLLVPIIGRAMALFSCSLSNYAREDGMGESFIKNCGTKEAIFGVIFSLITSIIVLGYVKGLATTLIVLVIIYLLTKNIKGKIGGMTGDTVGFVIELSQTFFLLSNYVLRSI